MKNPSCHQWQECTMRQQEAANNQLMGAGKSRQEWGR
ncbi:hypothetical protein E2C01_081647 [Portunus trituberculatus]|uniref:Uncharacterized protein n=1 Tax=Portunus trituberculatus TaxID=210409 RepID=A0A5B7IMZ1_PORTR|nr:hypothetical protein [Portunus trituberculatus]